MKFQNILLILLVSFSISDTLSSLNRDECEDLTNPEECYNMGCDWQVIYEQVGNELIVTEQCISLEEGDDTGNDYSCSDVNNPFECYAIGCSWEMNAAGEGNCVEEENMDDGGLDDGGNSEGNSC